jgi:hypothetical protein
MPSQFSSHKSLLTVSLMLFACSTFAGESRPPVDMASGMTESSDDEQVMHFARFNCLPKDVSATGVVDHGGVGKEEVTLEQTLIKLKAKCRNHKLVDSKRRQIRFFRPGCWGNPPIDYLMIRKRENEEVQKLKRRHTVIVLPCNPMIQ